MQPEATTTGAGKPFDFGERSAVFGERVLRFLKRVPRHPANDRLINQLSGAATSIGANFCEATESVSSRDFRNIIGRCRKEAKESQYFLRMMAAAEPDLAEESRALYCEARELLLILSAMARNSSANSETSTLSRQRR